VEPQLPFKNGRSDLLTGSGSRLDIENINLLATLLVHAQYQGYWSQLGMQFQEEMEALLERHPLLDVFGKIVPKIDDRRAHDAGKTLIPLVQDGRLGRLYLEHKIYCSVPSRRIRSPIQGCFRRVFCSLHYLGLLAFRRLTLTLFSTTVTDGRNGSWVSLKSI
jgi:hypothetical protein